MRSAWQRLTGASPRAVLTAAWLVLIVVGYPGRLPVASVELLRHAHAPHPSAAAWLWHVVEYVIAGPTGLLVAQASLAVAGAYALLGGRAGGGDARDPARAAWRTLAFVALPPVLATLTIVSAPTLAACLLLAGAGWLVSDRPRAAVVALALAGAAGNGLVLAALAIALLAGRIALRQRLIIAAVVAVVGLAGNLALPHAHPHAPAAALVPATVDPPTAPAATLLPLGIPTERSHVQDIAIGALDLVPALAAPALALVLVLAFAFVRRRDRTLLALAAAALLAEAATLVLAPDTDVYQSAALLALAVVIALRREPA